MLKKFSAELKAGVGIRRREWNQFKFTINRGKRDVTKVVNRNNQFSLGKVLRFEGNLCVFNEIFLKCFPTGVETFTWLLEQTCFKLQPNFPPIAFFTSSPTRYLCLPEGNEMRFNYFYTVIDFKEPSDRISTFWAKFYESREISGNLDFLVKGENFEGLSRVYQ